MVSLHWSLGIFAALAGLVLLALTIAGERAARGPMARANQVAARAYQFSDVMTRYGDCASTMSLAPGLSARWRALRGAMLAAQGEASQRVILVSAAARFFRMFMQSAILGFGAFLAIRHEISGGAIFAGSLLLGRCLAPIEAVTAAWRTTLSARDAYRRIGAIVPAASARPVTLPEPRGELALESVSWTPLGAERPVLRSVSLKIEAGAALAIIGPSAASKSTLARTLAGAIHPREGTVRLDGAELASWDRAQLGTAIGYLPQEPSLFPGTIAENIARFGTVSDEAIIAAAKRAHAHEMVLRLTAGYATMLDEGAATLSGGQKQRIALARALLADPPVLVLDEPNANLDAEGEAALISALQEARQRRRTMILITHNTALLRLADYVATMVAGQVMRVQPTTEFLNRPAKVAASA